MTRRLTLASFALLLAACQGHPPAAPAAPPAASVAAGASLAVRPAIVPGKAFRLQEVVAPYDRDAIDHLVVALHKLGPAPGLVESAVIQSVPVPKGSLDATITFGNLDYDTTYRVRAHAYLTAAEDAGSLISLPTSYIEIPVGRTDVLVPGNLLVNLKDRTFSATAESGGLTVAGGAVTHAGPATAGVNRPKALNMVETVASLPFSGLADYLDVAVAGDGQVYVADFARDEVFRLQGGTFVTLAGGSGQVAAAIADPGAVAVDAAGRVLIGEKTMITRVASGSATELAGERGTAGFADGPGSDARFNVPAGMAVAPNGDLIIADAFNHRIRRLTPGGAVSTVAGGVQGFGNGRGGAARFAYPGGVAVGPGGDLFVADTNNHRIRRIGPAGDVTTFAGSGTPAVADGQGTGASFLTPAGLAFDQAGHLWVADQTAVRRIAPDGTVTTVAGGATSGIDDGALGAARFQYLSGLAIAPGGDVYVVEQGVRRLRRLFFQAGG